jgi:hypothetical protein
MTKQTLNDFKDKLFWYVIPVLIGFFTWIVVMIYGINTNVQVAQKEASERKELQEKIYAKTEENTKMLTTKLDITLYNTKHDEVIHDIDQLKVKIDKIYNRQNFGITLKKNICKEVNKIDTMLYVQGTKIDELLNKESSFLVTKNNQLTSDANGKTSGGNEE